VLLLLPFSLVAAARTLIGYLADFIEPLQVSFLKIGMATEVALESPSSLCYGPVCLSW
jgi:hypothetical protein